MYLQMNLLRMCGHKDIDTPEDERSFGFPFDREISFQLTDDLKLVNTYNIATKLSNFIHPRDFIIFVLSSITASQ